MVAVRCERITLTTPRAVAWSFAHWVWLFGAVTASVATLAACKDTECDAAALQRALASAMPGDVVMVGSCVVQGPLVVPAGVTLRGEGVESSVVEGDGSATVVEATLSAGMTTRMEGLTVRSSACAALVGRGPGAFEVANVAVESATGVAIGVEGAERLVMNEVSLEGPVAEGPPHNGIPLPPYTCDLGGPSTHGLVVVRVPDVRLSRVTSRGFAAFGVLLVESATTWEGGFSNDHIGAGLEVYGGTAQLTDVELCRARQDTAPVESFNGVFLGGARIQSQRLHACEGEVFGLFHAEAEGVHEELVSEDNGFAGVWSQDSPSLRIAGEGSRVAANGFAAVAAFRVGSVEITDTTIADTAEGVTTLGGVGVIRAADGLHLVDNENVRVAQVEIVENDRVGLLIDLGGASTASVSLSNVAVAGSGAQLGAVAQNGTAVPGWDSAVTRDAQLAANDAAFVGALDIAGAVGPACFPVTDAVRAQGLSSLIP